jgi:hypothetical protein
VEEYGPSLCYIKGETNTGADALSRLTMVETTEDSTKAMDDVYALNEENICPITYNVLADAQPWI